MEEEVREALIQIYRALDDLTHAAEAGGGTHSLLAARSSPYGTPTEDAGSTGEQVEEGASWRLIAAMRRQSVLVVAN